MMEDEVVHTDDSYSDDDDEEEELDPRIQVIKVYILSGHKTLFNVIVATNSYAG